MGKVSQLIRAIEALDGEIAVLVAARERLLRQQDEARVPDARPPRTRKPKVRQLQPAEPHALVESRG